jgi:hypothetical protein
MYAAYENTVVQGRSKQVETLLLPKTHRQHILH